MARDRRKTRTEGRTGLQTRVCCVGAARLGWAGCAVRVTAGLCSSRAWRRTFPCGAASPPRTSAQLQTHNRGAEAAPSETCNTQVSVQSHHTITCISLFHGASVKFQIRLSLNMSFLQERMIFTVHEASQYIEEKFTIC